jgi:membrane fusion protein (multidrug efflux system)
MRADALLARHAISREEFDQRRESRRTAEASAKQALEEVSEARVALGLPPRPVKGELSDVPADLNQTFSGVREALAALVQSLAQVGLSPPSMDRTPKDALDEFTRPTGRGRRSDPGRLVPGRRSAGRGKLLKARATSPRRS